MSETELDAMRYRALRWKAMAEGAADFATFDMRADAELAKFTEARAALREHGYDFADGTALNGKGAALRERP